MAIKNIGDRKNPKWQVCIEVGTLEKRQRKYKTFKTKKEAEKWETEMLSQKHGGSLITEDVLLKDYIVKWFDNRKDRLAINTRNHQTTRINYYIIPNLGNYRLKDLKTATIRDFYNSMLNGEAITSKGDLCPKLQPSTANKVIEVLSLMFEDAREIKLVNDNPTKFKKATKTKTKVQVWNEHQLKLFIDESKDLSKYYVPYVVTALTGLRVAELCGLTWKNIDLKKGIIHITQQVIRDESSKDIIITEILKTSKSCRSITIPKSLIKMLEQYKKEQPRYITDLFICDITGKQIDPRKVSMAFTRTVSKIREKYSDLPQLTIHGLRHTHATMLLLKGENVKVIADRLGHESVKTTLDTYSHVLPTMRKETAELLDNVFTSL